MFQDRREPIFSERHQPLSFWGSVGLVSAWVRRSPQKFSWFTRQHLHLPGARQSVYLTLQNVRCLQRTSPGLALIQILVDFLIRTTSTDAANEERNQSRNSTCPQTVAEAKTSRIATSTVRSVGGRLNSMIWLFPKTFTQNLISD